MMASEDKIRPYVAWYMAALTAAGEAIRDGEDAGEVIRKAVSELSEDQARSVLQVMIAYQAERAAKEDNPNRK